MQTARAVSLIAGSIFCIVFTFNVSHGTSTHYLFSLMGNLLGVTGVALLLIAENEKRSGPKGKE